jgi:mRNA interferase MazF
MKKPTGARPSGANRGSYVPDTGDLVWLSFSPQAGREQGGRRQGLVLSPRLYNAKSGLCVVCPITTQVKGYPFEVAIPQGLGVAGVILSDHIKSADWEARRIELAGRAPAELIDKVRARLHPLLGT